MKKQNKKEWEEKKFKELNNLTFEEWWKMGEEENRNFIHQLLKEERLKTEQKGFGKGFKRCVREKVTDLDGKTIYCLEKSEKEIRQKFADELIKRIEKCYQTSGISIEKILEIIKKAKEEK